jgi:hypothetical protein
VAASVGICLALAALNRTMAPCSKLAFADWRAGTAPDRWVKVPAAAVYHRRFSDAMDVLSSARLARIERALGQVMAHRFGVDPSALALDMTQLRDLQPLSE